MFESLVKTKSVARRHQTTGG